MPAARSPARYTATPPYYYSSTMGGMNVKAQSSPLSTPDEISTPVTPISPPELPLSPDTPTKKRRAPNAFILYRSYIIAEKLYPAALTHQNDISRYVAENWRTAPAAERAKFFKMAKEEKERLEAELPEIEPSKRKRTRTSRIHAPRTDSPRYHLESPQSRESDAKFPTLTLPFDYSALSSPPQPQDIPAPTFDAYTLASGHGMDSLEAHMPNRPITYTLPDWDKELVVFQNDVSQASANHPTPHWASYQPSSSLTAYEAGTSSSVTLDAAMGAEMDFQHSLEGSTTFFEEFNPDLASYWLEPPPFGVYLPSMPGTSSGSQ